MFTAVFKELSHRNTRFSIFSQPSTDFHEAVELSVHRMDLIQFMIVAGITVSSTENHLSFLVSNFELSNPRYSLYT